MTDRIKAAVDSRTEESFFIMARTDSYASEGIEGAIDRCNEYISAGADGLFLEAVSSLEDYKQLKDALEYLFLQILLSLEKRHFSMLRSLHQ